MSTLSDLRVLVQHAMEQTIRYSARAMMPNLEPDMFRAHCERAALSAAVAFLLTELEYRAGAPAAREVAARLDSMMTDGEPMTEWVSAILGPEQIERIMTEETP